MFKLESYITPILLSYVDKYIKNFKPEDSQLSLWGGEVSLHNLDLRLEVLEDELQLPFTFVSGHIHELIIHVPWTKLYSEPICITINTIECILKLSGGESTGTDGAGSVSGGKERRRRRNKPSDAIAPPGYVQTMVNKIVSNITINCCNLIVKYVEEDIVMSMNVKNFTFQSANDKWEPEFSDFLSSQLMLRKIIKLSDVTVCLDKRNASGKIDLYQEPVLYRCSLIMRLLRCYNSPSAHLASVTKLDIHCHKMTFNISELQVPMMMRLLLLARALQNREVGQRSADTDNHIDDEEGEEGAHENFKQDSWTGWAWNLVPAVLPTWSQDWTGDETEDRGFTFHSGIYIDHLAFNIRLGGCSGTERNAWKNKADPFLTLSLRGCIFDYICHDNVWVNSQLGISSIQLEPIGPCSCGVNELTSDKHVLYFESGSYQENYSSESLFSSSAVENCAEKRRYNFSWDIHQNVFSESSLLEKTPALAIDYLYMVELTEKYTPDKYLELNGDLEYSDLPEHALCRTVMGPFVLRVTSGLLHRTDKVIQAAALYDYQPYATPPPEDFRDLLPSVTTEEYDSLEENIPLRTYQYTVFQPKVEFHLADHPNTPRGCKRKTSTNQEEGFVRIRAPILSVECQCMDARFISPMYPRRLVRSACLLPSLPQHMFHACHSHAIGRILGLTSHLYSSPQSQCQVFSVDNLLCKRKELFHPHLWEGHDLLHEDCVVEAEKATLSATKAQLLLIHQIALSLTGMQEIETRALSSLVNDALSSEGRVLEVMWSNSIWQKGLTMMTRCDTLTVGGMRGTLVINSKVDSSTLGESSAPIFLASGKEDGGQGTSSLPFLKACIQWPLDKAKQSHAPLLVMNVQEAFCKLDPLLYAWLLYEPSFTASSARIVPGSSDVNVQSVRSGHRKISDASGSHAPCEKNRCSQTPLSVHSSEKDRDIVPPPLVTQLSGLSFEQHTKSTPPQERLHLSNWLVQWFPIWQGIVVNIDVSHWRIDLPPLSLAKPGGIESNVVTPTDTVCVQLPVVQICSATSSHRHTQQFLPSPSKLPVHLPPSVWTEGCSNFPWNVSLSDLSMWTLSDGNKQHLLKPVTTKCTIGISTRFANGDKDCITSLGLCIHNDTGALHVTMNQSQAHLLSNVLLSMKVAVQSLLSQYCAAGAPATPAVPTSPTTISESASVSEPRNPVKTYSCDQIQAVEEPVKLSVWLQWTLARMSVKFYQHLVDSNNVKKVMKLALEVEDLMAALDLQQIYSKVKLKIAGANIHHYVRLNDEKSWQLSPYQGLVMCGYEEISAPSSGQVPADDGCGLLTATLTRAKCRNVHSRWGAPISSATSSKRHSEIKVPGHSNPPEACFITEVLIKLQPLDFLLSMESLSQWSSVFLPFATLFEEFSIDLSQSKSTSIQTTRLPSWSSASLPLLYLDLQAVRIFMPLSRCDSTHDTFIVQVDSVSLSPHAENPLWRTPLRPDIFHMAEQARILSVPGSEVEDRQYELNIVGLAISTGQWNDVERCRRLSAVSPASSLRTMSENPALLWNSLNTQNEASEIVGNPKPNLLPVLAPLKICLVGAPSIVYRSKVLVCGHALEINAVSDIDVRLSTNQMCLAVDLLSDFQTVFRTLQSNSNASKQYIPLFLMELAEKQYHHRLRSVAEVTRFEYVHLDSGIDTADISSTETPHSSRLRGTRRVSRSPRYLESVHGPSVHSMPMSHSGSMKHDRDSNISQIKVAGEHMDIFSSSRSSQQRERVSVSPELQARDRQVDAPFDFLLTAGKISLMLHEDTYTHETASKERDHITNKPRPLLFILATQPHMFLSQFSRSCNIQVSVYNTLVKLGSQVIVEGYQPKFNESDFPLTLFESCKGLPDLHTGVPPALCTVQWTFAPTKPAQLCVEFGRPAKLLLSTVNLERINLVLSVVSSCLQHCNNIISPSNAQDQSKTRLEQILENLSGVGAISFKSVQVVVAFQAENQEYIDSMMEVNISSLHGDLTCTSRTRWGCSVSAVERIVSHLTCEGLCLALSHRQARQLLVEPCNVKFRLELLWPSWLPRSLLSSLPHVQLTVQSEYVAATISPDHLLCLSNLWKAYKPYTDSPTNSNQTDSTLSQHVSVSTPASEVYSNETDYIDTEQHYTDDLRAGAFQFMDATNTLERDQIPLPYQCVFWESSPPAIAWRYPQPRSLTNVHIFPVPFKSAPDAEVGKEDAPVVVCSLQYWSECRGAYQHYATFLLSETNESKVDLPSTPGSAVSATWRVLLAGTRDLHDLSFSDSQSSDSVNIDVPEVSPRALAACMRIDSFFSASLAPNLQACFNLNFIQVSLMNQLTDSHLRNLPSGLEGYMMDGKVHCDHSFLWWSLNHFALFYSAWPEGRKIVDLYSLSRLDVLDYSTLSQQNVIDPFLSSACICLSSDGSTDVSVVSRTVACRLGPSVTHTIALSASLWQQELFPDEGKNVQVLTSQYVLCNNTVLPIVLGQVDTDEQIMLSSKQCHLYSWRSSSKKPVLHLSLIDSGILQLGKQLWSSPFPIDILGTHVCQIAVDTDKQIIIFIEVSILTTTQKQVTLSGQVQVLNQVNQPLDLRIMRSSSDWSLEACQCIVPLRSDSITPSLLLDRHSEDPQLGLRLRLRQEEVSLWTGDIPLRENPKSNQPWLVKVPLEEKNKFICIWCRIIRENVKDRKKILVILSPMYAVRSLLPTSFPVTISNDQDKEVRVSLELKGQGEVSLLHLPGALKENTHQLHLRTDTNIKIFPFGYSFVDQKQIFQSLEQVNIQRIVESSTKTRSAPWPLPNEEFSSIQWRGIEIPNSYVQASYSALSPYSGTMLLELRPWALLLNLLGCNVCIEQSGDTVVMLPSRGVVAPPKLEATFHVGLQFEKPEECFLSEALQLARADWSKSFYMPRISGLVPVEGHVQIPITCGLMAVSLLTIGSQIYNEVRIVHICSSFIVSNSSSTPLQVTALALRHKDVNSNLPIPRIDSPETVNATIIALPHNKNKGYPVEKWLHIKSCETDIVPYICVTVSGADTLSCPLPISGLPSRKRFVIPVSQEECASSDSSAKPFKSLVMCVVENNGQTFINIADDQHPQMILHNRCDFRILCAEASLHGKTNNAEFKIIPEASPWFWFCSVEPNSDMGYNMPSADILFPQITPLPQSLFVALAVDPPTATSVMWSSAIELSGVPEQCISLPSHGDVKVHIWMEGYTTHLSIEAVSRVEICAKDIRSRLLAAPQNPVLQDGLGEVLPLEPIVLHTNRDSQIALCSDEQDNIVQLQKHYVGANQSTVKLTMFVQSCSLTLTAPLTISDEIEVSVLTLEHIAVTSCPFIPSSSFSQIPEISVQVTLGDFQLDNQLFERGGFDFPVVLMGQQDKDEKRNISSIPVSLSATASQLVDKFSHQALLAVNITLESSANGLVQKSVHVSIGPITAYVEDKYIMDLKRHVAAILNPILMMWVLGKDSKGNDQCTASEAWHPAPLPVCLEFQVLRQPLRLTSLTVDPVWLLLSIHSSMRLYIALDRSPLQFTQFCRRSVFTTSYNLGHTLSMHYLSGAIFGAGWVVGSLELLGSPGGFARTLGTGLRDFVSLPYHGILQGPWGFLVGVTHGSASLMKHFTAGTLTSVTKMASSVARNLDRLTLDAEHLERTEELRRIRPQGVAEGLLQGLTGLGISLLGAVGGLAHHPLQAVLSGQPSPKGVVTGVGRGLVGVFTKPLSGAADLVAMTGQGLLQGAGWSNLPKPRHQARSERGKTQGCALIKYSSKVQQSNTPQCLLVFEATLDHGASRFKGVTLILTSHSLVILSADGDRIESQLPLVDLVLPDCDADPTMVTIRFKEAPPMVDQRMWDFVNGCRYVVNTGPPALEPSEDARPASPPPLTSTLPLRMETLEHRSAPEIEDTNPNLNLSRCSSDDGGVSLSAVQPAETTAQPTAKPPIVFHVNPQIRSHFLTLLKVAQRQMQGLGFQVL